MITLDDWTNKTVSAFGDVLWVMWSVSCRCDRAGERTKCVLDTRNDTHHTTNRRKDVVVAEMNPHKELCGEMGGERLDGKCEQANGDGKCEQVNRDAQKVCAEKQTKARIVAALLATARFCKDEKHEATKKPSVPSNLRSC